jgi:hypothetical protein
VANNNYPQITSVTSESLQAQIRTLLPSQEGFGTDLMAQNVIVPVIDLTAAAEGSSTSLTLQEAFTFDDITSVEANNNTQVIAETAGFWRINVSASLRSEAGGSMICSITMSDGLSTKTLWSVTTTAGNDPTYTHPNAVFTVFLNSGESISAVSNSSQAFVRASTRQIADVNGVLKNPAGFSPQ